MKNSANLGGCNPPRPLASVDNTRLDLQNSSYPTQPQSIIATISKRTKNMKFIKHFNQKIINLCVKIYKLVSYHFAKMKRENCSGRHFDESIIWLRDLTFFSASMFLKSLRSCVSLELPPLKQSTCAQNPTSYRG